MKSINNINFKKEGKLIANDTVNSTIMSIQIGFVLATALAFNEYIKKLLQATINKEGSHGHLKYALSIALVSGIVLSITSRYMGKSRKIPKKIIMSNDDDDE